MDALKEINSISNFRPANGVLLELYQLIFNKNLPKESIMEQFVQKGKNYYQDYNRLKEKLLEGILTNSFRKLSSVQRQHINLLKKYTEAKILILLDQRIAGVKLAEEAIKKAEELGILEIALSLSSDLETHFSTHNNTSKKYHFYLNKTFDLKQAYEQQIEMQQLFNSLNYAYYNKKPMSELFKQLRSMELTASNNYNYKFRLCYHHSINQMAEREGNKQLFLSNTKQALDFFDNCVTPLPYTTSWLFLINLVPIYISEKNYTQTEQALNICLQLPIKGSLNWHLTLLFKAIYGFYTNKPNIALEAWTKANSIPQLFDNNPIITERWQMIGAYLALYDKIGKLNYPKTFRFYTFKNTIKAKKRDDAQKANLVVLELLHLLIGGKKKAFIEKTWKIEQYLGDYFNKKPYKRTKYFLRSIRSVVDGNFHSSRVQLHAQKHLQKMKLVKEDIDLNLLDKEIVPYEFLWEEILLFLGKG